jgi:hypothetical protein
MLIDNKCEKIKASNCMEYENHKSCKSCPLQYGIKYDTISDLRNCVLLDIPNCLKSKGEFPFECDICSRGFYVDNNTCVRASANIENCKYLSVITLNMF